MNRKYHSWEKWECYRAGFYGPASKEGKEIYRDFLSKPLLFSLAIEKVFKEWTHSSEHFLTNQNINRIAWIGQAALCVSTGISSFNRGGFSLLSTEQQALANEIARSYLNRWENEYKSKNK